MKCKTCGQSLAQKQEDIDDYTAFSTFLRTGYVGGDPGRDLPSLAGFPKFAAQPTAGLPSDDGRLKTCDVCFRTEIDDLLESKPYLIPMRLADDGCWLCPDCDDWIRDGMPPAPRWHSELPDGVSVAEVEEDLAPRER